MKVRASVKKITTGSGRKGDIVVRRKNRSGTGPGRVRIINKMKRRNNQRQG